jgi:hypothetical protein
MQVHTVRCMSQHEPARDPEGTSPAHLQPQTIGRPAYAAPYGIPLSLSCHCSCHCPRCSTVTLTSVAAQLRLVRNGACWLACAARVPGSSHGESHAAGLSLPRRALHFMAYMERSKLSLGEQQKRTYLVVGLIIGVYPEASKQVSKQQRCATSALNLTLQRACIPTSSPKAARMPHPPNARLACSAVDASHLPILPPSAVPDH